MEHENNEEVLKQIETRLKIRKTVEIFGAYNDEGFQFFLPFLFFFSLTLSTYYNTSNLKVKKKERKRGEKEREEKRKRGKKRKTVEIFGA